MQAAYHLQNHFLKILVYYQTPPSATSDSSVIINAALPSYPDLLFGSSNIRPEAKAHGVCTVPFYGAPYGAPQIG